MIFIKVRRKNIRTSPGVPNSVKKRTISLLANNLRGQSGDEALRCLQSFHSSHEALELITYLPEALAGTLEEECEPWDNSRVGGAVIAVSTQRRAQIRLSRSSEIRFH